MLVVVYNSTLCKNPLVFFEKSEQTILIFILVQFGDLYCNHILSCPITHDFSPAHKPLHQTLYSRRLDPLEDFKHMQ